MRNIRIFFLVGIPAIILMIFVTPELNAQYNTAIGLRVGGTTGLTVKHFYKQAIALEGILGSFGNGYSLTSLIEKHLPIYNAPGLNTYFGGGAHLALYNGKSSYYSYVGHEVDYHNSNDVGFGINGIIGLEYQLPDNIPILVSIDLKPFIEFGSGGFLTGALDPSIGFKFRIN